LSIVGTTGLNTTFYIANIFLVGKEKEDVIASELEGNRRDCNTMEK
jgi:hypothetical protein